VGAFFDARSTLFVLSFVERTGGSKCFVFCFAKIMGDRRQFEGQLGGGRDLREMPEPKTYDSLDAIRAELGRITGRTVVYLAAEEPRRGGVRPDFKAYVGTIIDKGADLGDVRYKVVRDPQFDGVPETVPTDPEVGRQEWPIPAFGWVYGGFVLLENWKLDDGESDEAEEANEVRRWLARAKEPISAAVLEDPMEWLPYMAMPRDLVTYIQLRLVTPYSGGNGQKMLAIAFDHVSSFIYGHSEVGEEGTDWAQSPHLTALAKGLLSELRYASAFAADGLKRADIDEARLKLGDKSFATVGSDIFARSLEHVKIAQNKDKKRKDDGNKKQKFQFKCHACGGFGHSWRVCRKAPPGFVPPSAPSSVSSTPSSGNYSGGSSAPSTVVKRSF
jgi:hypothetical protein